VPEAASHTCSHPQLSFYYELKL